MRLIVNADDYGLDENRTRAIQEAFRLGAITQTTAMANMPWFARAMNEAKDQGFINRVGLHFNLSEGTPLSDEARNCPIICNTSGEFDKWWHHSIKTRIFLPKGARHAIAAEAKAQIERYLDCGGMMMHLDSHHHVHTDFSVATTLLPLAKHYGFRSVRMSMTIGHPMSFAKRVYKYIYNKYADSQIPFSSDEFTDFAGFIASREKISLTSTIEIMVHPLYGRWDALDMTGPLVDSADILMIDIAKTVRLNG